MSDLMILGVLRMPVTPDSDYLTLKQYIDRGRQAADTIEQQQVKIDELAATVERLRYWAYVYQQNLGPDSYGLDEEDESAWEEIEDLLKTTPRQNLNAVRCEVYADGYYDGFTDCRSYDFDSSAECEDMALHNADEKANQRYPDKE